MNKLEKQQNNINNLLKLIKENPDLEILPMIDSEIVPCHDYAYYAAHWGYSKVGECYCYDGRIYFREDDFEELVDGFIENNYEEYIDLTDEEFEKLAEEKITNLKWNKAIVIYIKAI